MITHHGTPALPRWLIATSILVAIGVNAQEDCDELLVTPTLVPVDYESQIQPILDTACVSCHQPGGPGHAATGLDLRQEESYAQLVEQPSAQDSDWLLVVPFSPQQSLLFHKMNCNEPPVGARMPKDMQPLSPIQQAMFQLWIVRGAPPHDDGDVPPEEPINFGMTGSWYDPETRGQGFLFDVVVDQDPPLMVVYWFTYGDQAGGPEAQRWFTAEGHFEEGDHRVELEVMMHTGGVFAQRPPDTDMIVVGVAELIFRACDFAIFIFDIDLDGDESLRQQGALSLTRLSPDVMCEVLSDDED